MFDEVIETEIDEIRQACKEEGGQDYRPQIVFIVSQMRTRCRFATDGLQNVPPGTVVDQGVTEFGMFDFYMVPHNAIKGTARPSHYFVLQNEANLTPDEIQQVLVACSRRVFTTKPPRPTWLPPPPASLAVLLRSVPSVCTRQ